ncbi:MAG: hypothetical protein IKF00_01330 [Solobacterium sp.]|nr:hypothetical protein [Solobacterium sp.]
MSTKKQGGFSELKRKFFVALKRKPFMIPEVALVITFLYYALHLTYISDTTAKIQGTGMGLAGFCIMLFSMLSFMCFINTFQYRKPVNKPMFAVMTAMFIIIGFANIYYRNQIYAAIQRPVNPIVVTMNTVYIAYAEYYLRVHLILLIITYALILLLPVYTKMLRKIKTSIEIEDNGTLEAIDISGEA